MKILIIEDERKAAKELKDILISLSPDYRIIDCLESVEDSMAWFEANPQPDLIFSDIQLADGLSFDIYRNLKTVLPIIFCTAFDEYALAAFEVNGIQYLLKPITVSKVQQSIERYMTLRESFTKENSNYPVDLQKLIESLRPSYRTTILVNFKEKIIPIRVDDVQFFYAESGVVTISLSNGQNYFLNETLEDFEKSLDPSQFFRVNRQFIVKRTAIKDLERYFARKLILKLKVTTPEEIVVSKVRASALLEWLELK